MGQPLAIHQLTNAGKSRLIGTRRERGRATAARGFQEQECCFWLSLKIFPGGPVRLSCSGESVDALIPLWGVWGRWGAGSGQCVGVRRCCVLHKITRCSVRGQTPSSHCIWRGPMSCHMVRPRPDHQPEQLEGELKMESKQEVRAGR